MKAHRLMRTAVRSPLAAALLLAMGAASAQPAQAVHWAATRTHAPNLSQATYLGNVRDETPVSVVVALELQNQDLMDSYLQDLFRPGSPSYHQWMSRQDTTDYFSPTPAQVQAVADYLKQQGFSQVEIAPNRLLVSASGNARLAQKAFHTALGRFSRNGEEGIANTQDAQVPAELGGVVHAVLGLQTLNKMRVHSRPFTQARTDQGTNSSGATYYFPDEFATVYHAGSTPKGTGTDVAIVGWGSMANSVKDLQHFEQDRGVTAVPTKVVTVGTASRDESGEGEWAMDAQAIVGISGGVKSLTFYAANSGNDDVLLKAINQAVTDNLAKVINMSWGSSEPDGDTGYFDSVFKAAVAQGQTFSASTGDRGSYPCNTPTASDPCPAKQGDNGTWGDKSIVAVEYPASSPYVIAVGGTTLSTDGKSGYLGEKVWPYGGGGISASEARPDWQSATVAGNYRSLPDVAFDADWENSPIHFFISQEAILPGFYWPVNDYVDNGGTSLASPLFVGAWARLLSANPALGFAPPVIYGRAKGAAWLHDVISGSNGAYAAASGWDAASGWGSFDIQALNTAINTATR